jgi:hypothetical protein
MLTTGLRCAPETGPTSRMITANPAAVASAFSSNWSPTSPGESLAAAIPEPTMTATSSPVPSASAARRRVKAGSLDVLKVWSPDR